MTLSDRRTHQPYLTWAETQADKLAAYASPTSPTPR